MFYYIKRRILPSLSCNTIVSILDKDASPGDKRTVNDDIKPNEAPLPSISSEETISLIQSALGPEIERRMEARRQMDIVAMETLVQFSDHRLNASQGLNRASDTEELEPVFRSDNEQQDES